MKVYGIDRLEEFEELRRPWESVWGSDPFATVFNSWAWLRGWLERRPRGWCILSVLPEDGGDPVAFLPLQVESRKARLRLRPETRVVFLGSPMVDRTGLVCARQFVDSSLRALAEATVGWMREVGAARLELFETLDPRLDAFLGHIDDGRFVLTSEEETPCPTIPLPKSWEEYMKGSKKRKRLLRRAARDGFRITHASETSLDEDMETFLELHQSRLGPQTPAYLADFRSIIRRTFEAGFLHLLLVRQGDAAAAANLGFMDSGRGTFHAYNGGWDKWFRKHSPRRVAELHSIRYAIERGCTRYDLGRGGEPYKFGFGAEERFNRNLTVQPATPYAAARRAFRRIPDQLGASPFGTEASAGARRPRASEG